MEILITGSDGFIAKNLISRLRNFNNVKLNLYSKKTDPKKLQKLIIQSDQIIHLAGENRSKKKDDFHKNNFLLSKRIADIIVSNNLNKKIIYSSTTQFKENNYYGKTKIRGEAVLKNIISLTKSKLKIYRLPNVFGKWSKPNYNSAIATFCYLISRGKKVNLFNENKYFQIIYIDDLIDQFIKDIFSKKLNNGIKKLKHIYKVTPKQLYELLSIMNKQRSFLKIGRYNKVLLKNLYSTLLSFYPSKKFKFPITVNTDKRGDFAEIMRLGNNGQFSIFTINKNEERGGHYHDTKVEKFIILNGKVRFIFFDLNTKKRIKIDISDKDYSIIETIPGYVHKLINIGNSKVTGAIWSNEEFSKNDPDTFNYKI